MKKFVAFLCLIISSLFVFTGCVPKAGTIKNDEDVPTSNEYAPTGNGNNNEPLLPYTYYNRKTYVKPYWTGNIVYNENAMFVGTDDQVPLMYPAEEIISVRSYDLKTEYTEGVDYIYDKATNRLTRTAGSRMPYVPFDWYYPTDAVLAQLGLTGDTSFVNYGRGQIGYFETNNTDVAKKRVLFSEQYFNGGDSWEMGGTKQIAITYRHAGDIYIDTPDDDSTNFASQLNSIKSKSNIKICFFGDSVTVGCNSGSVLGWEPYSEPWAKMVFDTLSEHYGISDKSDYKNLAVGGWDSYDGIHRYRETFANNGTVTGYESTTRLQQVVNYAPDIFFLGFGLNDIAKGTVTDANGCTADCYAGTTIPSEKYDTQVNKSTITFDAATHTSHLRTIIEAVLAANPNCIICLVGSYLPYPEVTWVNQKQLSFRSLYPSLANSLENTYGHHVFFADMLPEHYSVLANNKRYYDGTSNNVNHPNDFICRLYAQTILYTICGDYTADLY